MKLQLKGPLELMQLPQQFLLFVLVVLNILLREQYQKVGERNLKRTVQFVETKLYLLQV